MLTFRRFDPESEKELHSIIGDQLGALEEGLVLLRYEMGTGSGIPDFLCVDSGGRLVVIEVKLNEDDSMLFQALRYYRDVDNRRYELAKIFSTEEIKPRQRPRIILIAKHFSDDLRRLTALVKPVVDLFQYVTARDSSDNRGILFRQVYVPNIDDPLSDPATVKDRRDYVTKEELRPVFDAIRAKIIDIGRGISEYATQNYVGYRFKGRQFAWIGTQRKSLDIGVIVIDANKGLLSYEPMRIESDGEDYSDTLLKIMTSFQNLGGRLKSQSAGVETRDQE